MVKIEPSLSITVSMIVCKMGVLKVQRGDATQYLLRSHHQENKKLNLSKKLIKTVLLFCIAALSVGHSAAVD